MKDEVREVIKEKGLLLDKKVLELLDSFKDPGIARDFLINIEKVSGEKMITMGLLNRNVEFVNSVVRKLPGDEKRMLEKTFVKFGYSLEVRKESEIIEGNLGKKRESNKSIGGKNLGEIEDKKVRESLGYKVFYADTNPEKKIEVSDFTKHFRERYRAMQGLLMNRTELGANLVSINKISRDRQSLSIIAYVLEKRVTKNKNLIIKFEDLTGTINGIVKVDNEALFEIASELQEDDVVGVKASGNCDMIFVHDIFFPDAFLQEKTKFREDINILFLSDIHCGSNKHLGKSFEGFLKWINSEDPEAKKIKYIFFVGDNVDGVGIFPGQEEVLELKSMKEQYALLATYLKKIPERITMFMCPGQHDASRVAEPQPLIDRKYAKGLYEIENLVLVTNPCMVKLVERRGDKTKEYKVLMYHGASMHANFINPIRELREMKAHRCPAKAVRHMLKRRHLAPSHGLVVYIPKGGDDPMMIKEVPDVLCTGEMHRLDIENYNGVKIIVGSCWQAQTDFEEKVGNIPDPCKVPVLNLKSGGIKVYDFSDLDEMKRWG